MLIAAIGVVAIRWRSSGDAARLPEPPTVAGQSAAVREHLRQRYEAASAAPTSIAAVAPLCVAYHADMFFDHADRCYAVATDLDPGEWRWTYSRALIQYERGGGESMIATLRRVVMQAPQFGPAWLRLAEAEFKASRYDAAGDAWRRVRDLPEPAPAADSPAHVTEVPLAAYASLGLARVALVRGDAGQARDILERVIRDAVGFGPAFRLLAESYRALGREAAAERAVRRAGRLPPYAPYTDPIVDALTRESRNTTVLLRVASEANLAVNAAWSEYLSRRAVEFDPDNPEAIVKLGRVLRTLERNDEALALFERYHQMVPGDVQGLAHIGSCLSALGRYSEAESYFRRALAGRDDPVTHYNLGLLMAVTGRLDEAVREYERALASDPMHIDARVNLATTLTRQGDLARATRELTRVIDDDPENASARTNLGVVLLQQGRVDQARRELQEALRINPSLAQAAEALQSITER